MCKLQVHLKKKILSIYSYHIRKERIESLKNPKKNHFFRHYTAIKLQKSETPFSKVCLHVMNIIMRLKIAVGIPYTN